MVLEKRFPTALFGFNKKKVNQYLENSCDDHQRQLTEKTDENLSLRRQNMELLTKCERMPNLERAVEKLEQEIYTKKMKSESYKVTTHHCYCEFKNQKGVALRRKQCLPKNKQKLTR